LLVLAGLSLAACGPSVAIESEAADLLVVLGGQVYLGWSATGELELLLDNDLEHNFAVWSPDGSRVAWNGVDSTGTGIGVVDVEKGETSVVSVSPADQLEWSPDGRKLAFRSRTAVAEPNQEPDTKLLIAHLDGSIETEVPTTTSRPRSPAWSPDGRWIAIGGNPLALYDAADGQAGPTFPVSMVSAYWSIDSSRLLVGSNDGLQFVDVDSGDMHVVSHSSSFAWSEEHDRLAIRGSRREEDGRVAGDLLVLSETDLTQRLLAIAPAGFSYGPIAWSPDGEHLLVRFSAVRGPGHEDTQDTPAEIRIINVDGSEERTIVRGSAWGMTLDAAWRPRARETRVE
jgi:dipeptidyl aminopeptidase/acylaminoacyl peptidase